MLALKPALLQAVGSGTPKIVQESLAQQSDKQRPAGDRRLLTSVWNLLSHKYNDVLIGLKGSKSMLTFFSFPSSVTIVPQ